MYLKCCVVGDGCPCFFCVPVGASGGLATWTTGGGRGQLVQRSTTHQVSGQAAAGTLALYRCRDREGENEGQQNRGGKGPV